MLTGALMVSAINGSPYETLKNAAFDALFLDNLTLEGEVSLTVDGQVQEQAWIMTQIGNDSTFTRERSESPRMGWDSYHISYANQELRINHATITNDGTQWYSVRRMGGGHISHSPGYEMFGTAGRNSNQLRLAELVIDLFVGDLKNNLTISSQGDDMRRVSGAITGSQLPEIVRVLIDVALDEMNRFNTREYTREDFIDSHVLEIPIVSISIDRISGHADIDSDGNLRSVVGSVVVTIQNIFGDTHEIEGAIDLSLSDIGTTMTESPFPGASELFTEELFLELAGRRNGTLYFTVDEDGNINQGSITDRWPSRADNVRVDSTPSTLSMVR